MTGATGWRTTSALTLALTALLLTASCDEAPESEHPRAGAVAVEIAESLDESLSEWIADAEIPGAAAAIVDDRRIVWQRSWGTVDGDSSRRVDRETLFSLQSMSKSVTALAVLAAVQDGFLDLDEPISTYLPDFSVNSIFDASPGSVITLRHLLSHRAGFTHEAPFGSNFDDRVDFVRHVRSISSTWLRYPVGHRHAYSNLGYDLAAYILERRSGQPFAAFVEERILRPLGMRSSSLDMEAIRARRNRATGHRRDNAEIPLEIPMIGAGGVYSNIADMAAYLQFHINMGVVDGRRLLREDLMEEMHRIQFALAGQRSGYCLGVLRDPSSGDYVVYHSGRGYGFQSEMLIHPKKKLGFVLLTNLANHEISGWRIRSRIQEMLAPVFGATPVDPDGAARMTAVPSNDPRVTAVIGLYGAWDGCRIFTAEGEAKLEFNGGGDLYPLRFYSDGSELVGLFGNNSEVRFLAAIPGRRPPLTEVNRRLGNVGFHVFDFNDSPDDPPGPGLERWRSYVGEYDTLVYGEPDDLYAVEIRNGHLYFGESRCRELEPGLFFTFDGQVLDLRSDVPSYANIPLRKRPD